MEHFIWNAEKYSVGNVQIDDQHQQVIAIINTLIDLSTQPACDSLTLMETLLELNQYASTHFETEESLLQQMNYPQLQAQHDSHEHYTEKVSQFIMQFGQGGAELKQVLNFIRNWWEQHILIEDMAFKTHFIQQH